MEGEKMLTVKKFAGVFGVTVGCIYDWIDTGKIKVCETPHGMRTFYQIPESQIEVMKKRLEIARAKA